MATLGFRGESGSATGAASIPATGTTTVATIAIPTDELLVLIGRVYLGLQSSGHMSAGAYLTCEAVVKNNNGTVTICTALASSNDPATSTNLAGSRAQAVDAGILSTGTVSATLAVSGTNIVLQVVSSGIIACDAVGSILACDGGAGYA